MSLWKLLTQKKANVHTFFFSPKQMKMAAIFVLFGVNHKIDRR
jgi:hypothetical protein